MKIFDNGNLRDMTPKETAEHQKGLAEASRPEELTQERKLELMLGSIPAEPVPTVEPKVGYRWEPMYTPSAGFAWELVADPKALGTTANPWYWVTGMTIKMGHHYTSDGKTLFLALQDGVAPELADGEWFAQL